MSIDKEQRLEAEIDCALKALPDLAAPPTLLGRVMRAIEARSALPWFKRAWQTWPLAPQVLAFIVLIAAFAGLSVAGWQAADTGANFATEKFGVWFSGAGAICSALNALLKSGGVVLGSLGHGFLIGCLVSILLAYALCVGLTALYIRLVRLTFVTETKI